MKIKPLGDRIVLKADPVAETTSGGLYASADIVQEDNIPLATVMAAGPKCTLLKEGSRVIYAPHYSKPMKWEGVNVLMTTESSIVAEVVDEY
jgi:co-chaperonin GroES (HSP10)